MGIDNENFEVRFFILSQKLSFGLFSLTNEKGYSILYQKEEARKDKEN